MCKTQKKCVKITHFLSKQLFELPVRQPILPDGQVLTSRLQF